MMPGSPKECRDNAKQCLELALAARTQASRGRFECLAQRWMALATDYEAENSLRTNWGIPSVQQDGSIAPILCLESEAVPDSEPAAWQNPLDIGLHSQRRRCE